MHLEFASATTPDAQRRAQHLRRMCLRGEALQVSHGGYLLFESATPNRLEIAAAKALAVGRASPTGVVSGASAAVLHDLPLLWNHLPDRVLLNYRANDKPNQWRTTTRAQLAPTDITEVHGVRCTTPERTIVDLAAAVSKPQLLGLADAALRRDPEFQLRPRRKHHAHPVLWSAGHMSDRAESIGESVSRAVLADAGFSWPMLQADVFDEAGRFVARCDFAHPDGLLGEFDGKVKYDALVPSGQTAADVVVAEKQRENALRALGWELVRWDWPLLGRPAELRQRITSALARAQRNPKPRGHLRLAPVRPAEPRNWLELLAPRGCSGGSQR